MVWYAKQHPNEKNFANLFQLIHLHKITNYVVFLTSLLNIFYSKNINFVKILRHGPIINDETANNKKTTPPIRVTENKIKKYNLYYKNLIFKILKYDHRNPIAQPLQASTKHTTKQHFVIVIA